MFRIGFPGDPLVKNLPAKQKMPVTSLGQEDPLRKKSQPTPHSSLENPTDRGA